MSKETYYRDQAVTESFEILHSGVPMCVSMCAMSVPMSVPMWVPLKFCIPGARRQKPPDLESVCRLELTKS